jgi:hypothetical protein
MMLTSFHQYTRLPVNRQVRIKLGQFRLVDDLCLSLSGS